MKAITDVPGSGSSSCSLSLDAAMDAAAHGAWAAKMATAAGLLSFCFSSADAATTVLSLTTTITDAAVAAKKNNSAGGNSRHFYLCH